MYLGFLGSEIQTWNSEEHMSLQFVILEDVIAKKELGKSWVPVLKFDQITGF